MPSARRDGTRGSEGSRDRAHRQDAGAARLGPPEAVNVSSGAAADALRRMPGWKGQLRRRIGALGWDRIAGHARPKGCLRGRD